MSIRCGMKNIWLNEIWKKRRILFVFGPLLAGSMGFCEVALGINLPKWLLLLVMIISMPITAAYVILVWIYVYRDNKDWSEGKKSDRRWR